LDYGSSDAMNWADVGYRRTAARQASAETDEPLLADSLEGDRSVGAAKSC